ncbi:hypothetical protein [Sessilibacter sp. MAH4]
MARKNFSNFIYFSRNTMGNTGKPVYIDPNLIVDFVTYVNPNDQKNGGYKFVIQISKTLISMSAGGADGKSPIQTGSYMKDINHPGLPGIRIYYESVQHKTEGTNKGPGIYIYAIKPLKHNESSTEGLYKVNYDRGTWRYEKKTNDILDEKLFFISAIKNSEKNFHIEATTKSIGAILDAKSDKSNSNLYYCPSYLVDNGEVWTSPNDRISSNASANELAQILIDSENSWKPGNHGDYETIVMQDSVKVLIQALEKVKEANVKLSSHKFSLNAPFSEIHRLEKLIEECGGQKSKLGNSTHGNKVSELHQAMANRLLSEKQTLANSQKISESNITFADLVQNKGFDHEAH